MSGAVRDFAEITEHPKMDFADYERRLTSFQGALQLIQQAYLGTSERALLVLEGWDTAHYDSEDGTRHLPTSTVLGPQRLRA